MGDRKNIQTLPKETPETASSASPDDGAERALTKSRKPPDRTLTIIEQLKSEPVEKMTSIVEAVVNISRETDPSLIRSRGTEARRQQGMWIGAGMSIIYAGGGVALLLSSAPAVIGIGLLCLGAACTGATFAVMTGKSVGVKEFSDALAGAKKAFTGAKGSAKNDASDE